MAMLARAGVPLEQGLVDLGRDWRGRVGRAIQSIGEQLKQGRTLSDVLSDPKTDLPPAYRAVVLAGVRSGQLGTALQDVATVATRAAESRRLTWFAFLYPTIVVATAYTLGMYL